MKIPAAEAAVDFLTFLSAWSDSVCVMWYSDPSGGVQKGWEKLKKNSGVESGKSEKWIRSDRWSKE